MVRLISLYCNLGGEDFYKYSNINTSEAQVVKQIAQTLSDNQNKDPRISLEKFVFDFISVSQFSEFNNIYLLFSKNTGNQEISKITYRVFS